jgi:protein SCO1
MKNIFKAAAIIFVLSTFGLLGLIWHMNHPPLKGGDFTLNNNGQEWNFKKNAKKLNLLYIGYTKCPDICPMTMAYAGQAFSHLTPEQLDKVQFAFVSVDYTHDTPQAVHDYAVQFFKGFMGLTGTQQQIDLTVNSVGASYILEENVKSYLGYSITHSDRVFFLDDQGLVIDTELAIRSEDQILKKIKEHL